MLPIHLRKIVCNVSLAVAILAGPARLLPAQDADPRAPVPTAAAQKEALRILREIYEKDFEEAKTVPQKQSLAKKLLEEGIETRDDDSSQFVLLKMAADLAVEAGDGLTAFTAIDEIAKTFQTSALDMKTETLSAFAKKAPSPMQRRSIVQQAFALMEEAVVEDNFPMSEQLGEMALKQARKVRDGDLVRRIRSRVEEIKKIAEAYAEVMPAKTTLEQNPVDPEANLAVGKYLCLLKGDWKRGVSMLALGNDAALKTLAVKELKGTASHAEEVKLGDGWWKLAGKEQGYVRKHLMERAEHWYRRALPGLSGLSLTKLQKRLDQIFVETAPQFQYLSDMQPEIVRARGSVGATFSVGGFQVPHGLWAHSAGPNYHSLISYNLRGAFRQLSGIAAIADSGDKRLRTPQTFRVVGDGKLLWKSHTLKGRGDTEAFQLDIAGVEKLELFVDCPGDWHYAHAAWVEPVVSK